MPVTQQQLNKLPYSAVTLKWGEGPRVLSALALYENGQQKWLTKERNMVVTQHGRIVKTLGFPENISYTANLSNDPIANWLSTPERQWRTQLDWQPGNVSGMEAISSFEEVGLEPVVLVEQPETLLRVEERVTLPRINKHYVNVFWLWPDSGKVAKTQQYLGPDMPVMILSFVKP